ncbi:MAG: PAS domain-containing protein [Bacteroidota bacterium]
MKSSSTMPVFPALEEVAMLSSDAIFIVDLREHVVSFANPAATALVHLESGDLLSKVESSLKMVHLEDHEYVRNKYSIVATQPSTTNIEFRILKPSGEIVWLTGTTYLFNKNRFVSW